MTLIGRHVREVSSLVKFQLIMNNQSRVLLIEDSKVEQMLFQRLVKEERLAYDYCIAGSVAEAKKFLSTHQFDIVITDFTLDDGTAFDVFGFIKDLPIIVITGVNNSEIAVQAMKLGATDYLIKDSELNYLKVLPITVEKSIKQKRAEKEYRLLSHALMNIRDSVYITDSEDKIIFVNPAFCKTYGYQESEIIGQKSSILWSEYRPIEEFLKIQIFLLGKDVDRGEFYHHNKAGNKFPVFLSCTMIQENGDEVKVFVVNDITERKQAEAALQKAKDELEIRVQERTAQLAEANKVLKAEVVKRIVAETEVRQLNIQLEKRVIERTAQLEAANKELEAFSYSVSHDLRSPLRSIDGFSQALLEDYQAQLDDLGKDYLRRVRAAAQRMGELIDDLLQLSRLTRSPMKREPVNLSAIARSIATQFQETGQNTRQVEFIIPDDIIAIGDERLLQIVLENLLGNAWKYTSTHPTARIEFGTNQENKGAKEQEASSPPPSTQPLTYFVRDDGAGFDMAYADKLFGVFQRLHGTHEFEGTGIGLATVQRIVHRHGGSVWAEGAVEQGATFYFTLGNVTEKVLSFEC